MFSAFFRDPYGRQVVCTLSGLQQNECNLYQTYFNTNFKRSVEDKNNDPSPLSEVDESSHQMSDSEKYEIKTPPPQEMDCSGPDMKAEISDASDGEQKWISVSEHSTNVNSPSNTNSSAKEEAAKNRLTNETSVISYRNFGATRSANKSQVVSSARIIYTQKYGKNNEHGAQYDAGHWK